jgi:release factor glutamine methyltransferase
MKTLAWLATATAVLTRAGIATARLDCLVLLEDCLGKDRAHILAHPELDLTNEHLQTLNEQIKRRVRHVPLAYIRGKTEFYGREFIVNNNVLEPRPESETIIDLLKKYVHTEGVTIIDVGTGSGALAITAKLELPKTSVAAIDIDSRCLEVARQNAVDLKADIRILQGDLLNPIAASLPTQYILLCNLPYVPNSFQINTAAGHEPRIAIFGGVDGLDPYRSLFAQIESLPHKPQLIITEAMPPQHPELAELAAQYGFALETEEDFIQVFRPTTSSATTTQRDQLR